MQRTDRDIFQREQGRFSRQRVADPDFQSTDRRAFVDRRFDGAFIDDARLQPVLVELVELLEAEGLRNKVILACGGPRISHELAQELGYDAGFGMNTYADDVASYIAQEYVRRNKL